jgi:hypothetical protein
MTYVTRLTRRVPLVEQELLTLPEHPISLLDSSGVFLDRGLLANKDATEPRVHIS